MCFAKGMMLKEVTDSINEGQILQRGLWMKVNTVIIRGGTVA